jgi:hypothetical protein
MKNGADPNLIRLEDGRSPLHYSAQFGNVDQVFVFQKFVVEWSKLQC